MLALGILIIMRGSGSKGWGSYCWEIERGGGDNWSLDFRVRGDVFIFLRSQMFVVVLSQKMVSTFFSFQV